MMEETDIKTGNQEEQNSNSPSVYMSGSDGLANMTGSNQFSHGKSLSI